MIAILEKGPTVRLLGLLLACAALAPSGWALADEGANADAVRWAGGWLSVKPTAAPLSAVLRSIEVRAGVEFKGIDTLSAPVTRGVESASLVDGLRLLLADQSYLIIAGARGRPTRVIVVGLPASPARVGAPPGAGTTAAAPSPLAAIHLAAADTDPAVRIEAVERLGDIDDERSLSIIQRAMTDSNEAVRAVAKEALDARRKRAFPERALEPSATFSRPTEGRPKS